MKIFLLIAALFFILTAHSPAGGTDHRISYLRVDVLSLEAYRITHKRDPFFSDRTHEDWLFGAALNWDLMLIRYRTVGLYWENRLYLDVDNQVRHVGWEWDLGIQLGRYFDLFYQHHSRHALDEQRNGFPFENRFGVRLNLIRRDRR